MWARSSIISPPIIEIGPNPIACLASNLAGARCPGHFNKIVTGTAFAAFCRANDREMGKTGDPTTNHMVFPDVDLSYQAPLITRIVHPSDKPVSRDRPIVIVFNPAETT
jgi:hypothetical protein